ncbi:RNA polymerase sigma factor [Paludibacter sp. 221]|uniref:RNA polymerase sigma factor n=1 Tax=Paludibacter sp. 221 TaxID=2302939 RepID=UPI0013D423BC|nr:RNA polymerase sigma factor [Paludibacter sp. 221]NDV47823.1 RNA polymerase sigma factor [Paludibacter sp. 221]
MDSITFNNQILILSNKLFRLAKSILKNDDDAQDAVQELNKRLWEKNKQLDKIENIPAFIMRSMRNMCLDILKYEKRNTDLTNDIEYTEHSPYTQAEQKDMYQQISNIIDRLPETQRNVIRLRDVEEMEIEEIAYIMQMTESAVYTNLSRARLKVREQLIPRMQ